MNIRLCLERVKNSASVIECLTAAGTQTRHTYGETYTEACLLLGALQEANVCKGRHLLLCIEDITAYIVTLWACWLGGIIPVSAAVPADKRAEFFAGRWSAHRKPVLITDRARTSCAEQLSYHALKRERAGAAQPMPDSDIALMQYTSGTASAPRCVMLTGKNLYEGALASSIINRPGVRERYLGWLPINHIFGLVANHLVPLFNDFDQYLMPTAAFIERPSLWPESCAGFGATVTSSSVFGLELAEKHAGKLSAIDLSAVYACLCGGEDIKPESVRRFERRMSVHGWREATVLPAYGLSEATMGVSCTPPGTPMRVDGIDPSSVSTGGRLRFVSGGIQRVSAGLPDACNIVQIRNPSGEPLPEGYLGAIYLKGTNIMAGYWPPADAQASDGWLNTGDLGYMRDGWLTVFARDKDMLCHNGLNYARGDLERVASAAGGGELVIAERAGELAMFSEALTADGLRAAAAAVAAAYRLPITKAALMERLPRTGKAAVDRLALAMQWESGSIRVMDLTPECVHGTDGLTVMRELWAQVLPHGHGAFSPESRFTDCGGDSLSVMDLACAIEERLGVFVEAEELFTAWTLEGMAELVEKRVNAATVLPN